jgi:RNA polymerase sigma-70 factor (ECF subfamily)
MNKAAANPVFVFEGRRTVAEQALASSAVLMVATNEDALETAVREHARLVYRIAYSVLRNHHDAEDATQETFIRVMRYRRKLQGVDHAKTYLARIAWRVALERGKSRTRPEVSLSEATMTEAMVQLRSQLASGEQTTLGNEMAALLESLISALPKTLQDPLRLSTVEEFEPREIADLLRTSEAAVRSRLFRARQILKEKLQAFEGNHGSPR